MYFCISYEHVYYDDDDDDDDVDDAEDDGDDNSYTSTRSEVRPQATLFTAAS